MKINKNILERSYSSQTKLENDIAVHLITVIEETVEKLSRDGKKAWMPACKQKARAIIQESYEKVSETITKKAEKVSFDEMNKIKDSLKNKEKEDASQSTESAEPLSEASGKELSPESTYVGLDSSIEQSLNNPSSIDGF